MHGLLGISIPSLVIGHFAVTEPNPFFPVDKFRDDSPCDGLAHAKSLHGERHSQVQVIQNPKESQHAVMVWHSAENPIKGALGKFDVAG